MAPREALPRTCPPAPRGVAGLRRCVRWACLALVLAVSPLWGGAAAVASPTGDAGVPGAAPDSTRPVSETRAAPDTSRWRVEAGVGTDVTNEQFYEDAFLADTTVFGRRLVSTPEARYAGVFDVRLEGTRARRALRYQLHHALSLGDLLQRGLLDLECDYDFAPDWRLRFAPRAELRHDRTFGRDLTEAREGATARLRHGVRGGDTFAELSLGGDCLRTWGRGADFILDRNAGSVSLALDHFGLQPGEWRLVWSLAVRSFPDSSERSHLEHGWEGRWRHVTGGGHALALETAGARRATLAAAPTTRDRFWEGSAALELELWSLATWSWCTRVEQQLLRYDREDSLLYLGTRVLRGRTGPRLQGAAGWSLGLAARGERLESPRDPGEEYVETGGELAFEWLGRRGWWSLAPAAGWREYLGPLGGSGPASLPGIHSSFAFYELTVFGEQPLPGSLCLRLSGMGRAEAHSDGAEDARSLYFSLDLRRLF